MSEEKKIYCGEPWEDPRCAENCHVVTLDNGIDLPYVEFGEENEEVVVSGAGYFITFNTFLKDLAKKYHVYGFIMRQDQIKEAAGEPVVAEEYAADGGVCWTRQWGKEVYEAAQKLGLERYRYVGKCHGVMPGWWIWRNHPEALISFASISQTMHVCEQDRDDWNRLQREDPTAFTLNTMRKKENFAIKAQETATVGFNIGRDGKQVDMRRGNMMGTHTEYICDSYDEAQELLLHNEVPILYLFPTNDILYSDFETANQWAFKNTARSRTVLLQGERHLFEMDIPHRMAFEVLTFFDWAELPDA